MYVIEFEEPHHRACDCCGNTTVAMTRFVSRNGDARAVYFAAFTEGHPERRVQVTMNLGQWGEGADPTGRVTFAFEIWRDDEKFNVSVIDGKDSLWFRESEIFGRFLSRNDALAHPWIDEVFRISDEIVEKDELMVQFLATQAP